MVYNRLAFGNAYRYTCLYHKFLIVQCRNFANCIKRPDVKLVDGKLVGVHFEDMFANKSTAHNGARFVPHPFNRRFAYSKRPLFPIEPRNLRILVCKC